MNTKQRIQTLLQSGEYGIKSIAGLERHLGISNGTINKWGRAVPNGSNLQKVSDYFNVSTDYLLGNTDEMRPAKKNPEEMDSVDLDKALSEHGVARFQGKELSDDYKRAVLAVLNTLNNDSKE